MMALPRYSMKPIFTTRELEECYELTYGEKINLNELLYNYDELEIGADVYTIYEINYTGEPGTVGHYLDCLLSEALKNSDYPGNTVLILCSY